jgi:hypothetical protein
MEWCEVERVEPSEMSSEVGSTEWEWGMRSEGEKSRGEEKRGEFLLGCRVARGG